MFANSRPVEQVRPTEDDDGLLGICKVGHNGRDPPKRTPGAHVPLGVLEALGAEPGDRIVWEEAEDGGVAFYPVSEAEWRELAEADEGGAA